MANMLRKKCSGDFGCCDSCARGRRRRSPGPFERRKARKIEKREWRKDQAA